MQTEHAYVTSTLDQEPDTTSTSLLVTTPLHPQCIWNAPSFTSWACHSFTEFCFSLNPYFLWASCNQCWLSYLPCNWQCVESAFPGKDYHIKFMHSLCFNIYFAGTQIHTQHAYGRIWNFFLLDECKAELYYIDPSLKYLNYSWLPQNISCAMFPNNFLKLLASVTIRILFEHSKFKSQEFFVFCLKYYFIYMKYYAVYMCPGCPQLTLYMVQFVCLIFSKYHLNSYGFFSWELESEKSRFNRLAKLYKYMVLKTIYASSKIIYYCWIVSAYSVEFTIKDYTYVLITFFKKLKYFSHYRIRLRILFILKK